MTGRTLCSELPLPITTRILPGEENFTGRVFGRLTVIGLLDDPTWKEGKKVRWVVRCSCGYYEYRRRKTLRTYTLQPPFVGMCSRCALMEERRNRHDTQFPVINAPIAPMLDRKNPYASNQRKKEIIPPEIRWLVWERDDFTCKHCGSRKHLSVDHIQAESKGGTMDFDNLQTLCKPCNSRKGAR